MKTSTALKKAGLMQSIQHKKNKDLITEATIAAICNVASFELRPVSHRYADGSINQAKINIPSDATQFFY